MSCILVKDVVPEYPKSWETKTIITIDIDWCSDYVLGFTIGLLEKENILATWFVTHDTPLLDRLRANSNFELGIHPNFNPLLEGDFRYGNSFREVIGFYKKLVPDAVSVRSHSLTQSTKILTEFSNAGLYYDCNCFIPFTSAVRLSPWTHWDGKLVRVPYQWEDDIHCMYKWDWDVPSVFSEKIFNVFNFHPIHIFLNTESINRYKMSRPYHFQIPSKLLKWVNQDSYGVQNFLIDLLEVAS